MQLAKKADTQGQKNCQRPRKSPVVRDKSQEIYQVPDCTQNGRGVLRKF